MIDTVLCMQLHLLFDTHYHLLAYIAMLLFIFQFQSII